MNYVVVGTAGHIDHGKSALVRALTGTDPDRLKEEKERGITIDLGFAHAISGEFTFAFVDVPGHERFVKNMLAGASGISAVLLVIASDESVMPQTREHFDICRLLRIPAGLVVLSKADLVDADTLDLVRLEARELVAGSFLDGAPILPVSSRTGGGLDELRVALVDVARRVRPRDRDGPARLPIDRAFSVRGFGTVVTGTVVSGDIAVDQELAVLPEGRRVKVRGLQAHAAAVTRAAAGQRLAVNLTGVEVGEVARGAVLASPGSFEPTARFDAAIELLPGARPLRHGARVRFHQGTSETLGRVAVSSVVDARVAATGSVETAEVRPGGRARVRIRLESPAVLTRGDRFILRAYSPPVTVAGGAVLDPHPGRGGIRTEAGRRRLARLDPGDRPFDDEHAITAALEQVLEERGAAGIDTGALVRRLGASRRAAEALLDRLEAAGRVSRLGEIAVAPAVLGALQDQLTSALAEYHTSDPLSDGIPREEARARIFARAHPAVFERVVQTLADRNALVARDRLALASHRPALTPDTARALAEVERAFRDGGLRPPDHGALAALTGLDQASIDQAVRLLQRQKAIVRLDTLWFHADVLGRLKDDIAAMKARAPDVRLDVAAFKQLYGVSRKYAIPLLEYLDRERVTRRVGESRIVL